MVLPHSGPEMWKQLKEQEVIWLPLKITLMLQMGQRLRQIMLTEPINMILTSTGFSSNKKVVCVKDSLSWEIDLLGCASVAAKEETSESYDSVIHLDKMREELHLTTWGGFMHWAHTVYLLCALSNCVCLSKEMEGRLARPQWVFCLRKTLKAEQPSAAACI